MINVKVKTSGDCPQYATAGSAGFDVINVGPEVPLSSGERALIHTGLYFEIPEGYEIQVRPRSGLALKRGITVLNSPGTIDSDYRGECNVIVINTSSEKYCVSTGERIAQFVLNKVEQANFVPVNELGDTARGTDGFGSTGLFTITSTAGAMPLFSSEGRSKIATCLDLIDSFLDTGFKNDVLLGYALEKLKFKLLLSIPQEALPPLDKLSVNPWLTGDGTVTTIDAGRMLFSLREVFLKILHGEG
jgi:dUTP pyrophosphatase